MSKVVTVRVPEKMNLEQCQKILAQVLGKAGCPNCYSGFKISFENAVDPANIALHVDRNFQLNEIGH